MLKIDQLTRRAYLLRVLAWVLIVVAFVFLGRAGPKPLQRYRHSAYNCPDPNMDHFVPDVCTGVQMSKGNSWEEEIAGLNPMNQFLVLEMQAQNLLPDRGTTMELPITVTLMGYDKLDAQRQPVGLVPILINGTHYRALECAEQSEWCDKIPLLHLSWLEHSHYMVTINFAHTSNTDSLGFIGDVAFQFTTVNMQYSEFTVVVKWLYILMTLEVLFLFHRWMKKIRNDEKVMPQRWVFTILFGLVWFNDPLCVASVVGAQPSWILPLISLLIQTSFLFLLLLFWILVLDVLLLRPAMENEEDDSTSIMVKYMLVTACWLGTCILITWMRVNQAQDPMLTYATDFPYYEAIKYTVMGAGVLYMFWICHMAVKALDELNNDQYRRFFTTLILSLTVAGFIVIATLLHVLPYVGEGELVHTRGSHFAAMLALINWYCYVMAYFYLPAGSKDESVYETLYKDATDEL